MKQKNYQEQILNLDHIDFPDPVMEKFRLIEKEMHLVIKEFKKCRERRANGECAGNEKAE